LADYLTVAQVAESVGVTERAVRGWIAEGRLRAFRVAGRIVRVKASDVAELFEPIAA